MAPPPNCVIKVLCPHLQGKGGARNAVAEAVVFPQNPFRRTRCGRKGIGFANLHFARRRFLHLPRFPCAFPLLHDVTASCRWWVRFLILRSLGLQRRHQGSQVFNAGARDTCGAVKPAIDASEESIDLAFAMLFGEEVNGITSLPSSTGELVYVCHEIPASEVRAHVRPYVELLEVTGQQWPNQLFELQGCRQRSMLNHVCDQDNRCLCWRGPLLAREENEAQKRCLHARSRPVLVSS